MYQGNIPYLYDFSLFAISYVKYSILQETPETGDDAMQNTKSLLYATYYAIGDIISMEMGTLISVKGHVTMVNLT